MRLPVQLPDPPLPCPPPVPLPAVAMSHAFGALGAVGEEEDEREHADGEPSTPLVRLHDSAEAATPLPSDSPRTTTSQQHAQDDSVLASPSASRSHQHPQLDLALVGAGQGSSSATSTPVKSNAAATTSPRERSGTSMPMQGAGKHRVAASMQLSGDMLSAAFGGGSGGGAGRARQGTMMGSTARALKMPQLTEQAKHVFVMMREGAAPALVYLSLRPPAPIAPTSASPQSATHSTLCIDAYEPASKPKQTPAATPTAPLALASVLPAHTGQDGRPSIMVAGAAGSSAAPASPTATAASSGSAAMMRGNASPVGFAAGVIDTATAAVHASAPSSPMAGAGSSASASSSSSSSSSSSWPTPLPAPIELRSFISLTRGFKSKRFAALRLAEELEPAAFTLTYNDASGATNPPAADAPAGDAASMDDPSASVSPPAAAEKRAQLHFLALSSKSCEVWLAALECVLAAPRNVPGSDPTTIFASPPSLDAALRAANTKAFASSQEADVHYHALVQRQFLGLAVPPAEGAAGAGASPMIVAVSALGDPTAPRLPSRRASKFHNEYASTMGGKPKAAGRHGRSSTLMIQTSSGGGGSNSNAGYTPFHANAASSGSTIPAAADSSSSSSSAVHLSAGSIPVPPQAGAADPFNLHPSSSPPQQQQQLSSHPPPSLELEDLMSPVLTRCIDALPLLKAGAWFLKLGRSGPPTFRFYALSDDRFVAKTTSVLTKALRNAGFFRVCCSCSHRGCVVSVCLSLTLIPYKSSSDRLKSQKVPSKSFDLRAVEKIQLGQASARFAQSSLAGQDLAAVSFTVLLRADALVNDVRKHLGPSLVALTLQQYHVWTRGLIALQRTIAEHDAAVESLGAAAVARRHSALLSAIENERARGGSTDTTRAPLSPSSPSHPWPPAEVAIDVPAASEDEQGRALDTKFVSLEKVKGVDQGQYKKIKAEIVKQKPLMPSSP